MKKKNKRRKWKKRSNMKNKCGEGGERVQKEQRKEVGNELEENETGEYMNKLNL